MSDISNPAKQTDPVEQDIPALEDYRLFFPETDRFPELRLRHCGYEKCAPGHSFGPAVRGSFLIHIVLEGRGSYMVNQQTYRLGAGDGFLILPELQTFYKADDDDPWTYVWIGFEGRSAEDVIHDMGLGRESLVFHSSRPQDLRSIDLRIADRMCDFCCLYVFCGICQLCRIILDGKRRNIIDDRINSLADRAGRDYDRIFIFC